MVPAAPSNLGDCEHVHDEDVPNDAEFDLVPAAPPDLGDAFVLPVVDIVVTLLSY